MSVATIAIFDWPTSAESKLAYLLETMSTWGIETNARVRTGWGPEDYTPEQELVEYGQTTFWTGTERFFIGRRSIAVMLNSDKNWLSFLTNELKQRQALERVAEICGTLGVGSAIFVPDCQFPTAIAMNLLSDGKSTHDIMKYLGSRFGSPAQTPTEIYARDSEGRWSGNGYFVAHY